MRRSKVVRLAQNQIFRLLDVGIDRLIRLLGATGQAGQRHRRAHQLHEAAPRNRIDPLLRLIGKLLGSPPPQTPAYPASSSIDRQ
jgi:hypothetical protein